MTNVSGLWRVAPALLACAGLAWSGTLLRREPSATESQEASAQVAKVRRALASGRVTDPTTKAHLEETQTRIGAALQAQMQRPLE